MFDEFVNADRAVVVPLTSKSLTEANPGYRDVAEVVRLFADGASVHVAAHWIDGAVAIVDRDYSCVHAHDDLIELNVLLGEPDGLSYQMVLGRDKPAVRLEAPCAVVIPPGVPHSANVIEGRGWFVVVRIPIASAI